MVTDDDIKAVKIAFHSGHMTTNQIYVYWIKDYVQKSLKSVSCVFTQPGKDQHCVTKSGFISV